MTQTATEQRLPLADLLAEIRACAACEAHLPLGPRPVLRASNTARILIIGQAPGTRVHASGVPWDDPSGDRLRSWLELSPEQFYDESLIAIMPMGFCYPGKGKSGDLPPRRECAPLWHQRVLDAMPDIDTILLVGSYAQIHYLAAEYPDCLRQTLTQRVKDWRRFGPRYFPTPHPSPRNTLWLKRNPWFEAEVVPQLRQRLAF